MKSKNITIKSLLYVLLYLFSFAVSIYFIKHNYYTLINGDTSSELVLGKILNESNGILSKDWFYSTELRFLNTQIIYKIMYPFCQNNWMNYRIFSNIVLLLLLVLSYFFMMNALNKFNTGLITGWILLLPFSASWGYMVIYGAFYIPHIIISFLSFGLFIKTYHEIANRSKIQRIIVYSIFLILLCLFAGFGGARQGLICYIPLCITVLLDCYIMIKKKFEIRKAVTQFSIAIISLICFAIGVLINTKILAKIYSFKSQSSYIWNEFTLNNLFSVLSDFISIFGITTRVPLISIAGALNMFITLLMISLFVILIHTTYHSKDLVFEQRFTLFFTASSLLFCGIIYACDIKDYNVTYWIPIVPFFIPAIAIAIENIPNQTQISFSNPIIKKFSTMCILAPTCFLVSIVTCKYPVEHRLAYSADYSVYKNCAQSIQDSDYTEGFAPFWIASSLTELTNGKIEMWSTNDSIMAELDNTESIEPWLQRKSHSENLPTGKFLVVTYGKSSDIDCPLFELDDFIIYSDDYATVYGFDNLYEYRTNINSVMNAHNK